MQKVARAAFLIVIAAMLFLFFSNDFGLVDIHKASIMVAVGIDIEADGYAVTAQAAVPTPAQGEGSTAYTQVTGNGATVADAVDDVNAKTGFYPKLAFCNLVVLGESCKESNIFEVLDFFYRNDYVPLTALVGICRGSAKDLLGQKPSDGGMSSSAIQRSMSEELRDSANCSTVNLKMLAQSGGSEGAACFMPIIECSNSGSGGTTSASSSGGSSFGGSAKEGASAQGDGQTAEFTCLTTAAFTNGIFVGELDEEQSFALNLIKNPVRLAVVNTVYQGNNYTVGLKNNSGSASVTMSGGSPELKLKYRALANVQSAESSLSIEGSADSHLVPEEVLQSVAATVKGRMQSLVNFCREKGCDLLGAEGMFYRFKYKYYNIYKYNILEVMQVKYDVKISSVR